VGAQATQAVGRREQHWNACVGVGTARQDRGPRVRQWRGGGEVVQSDGVSGTRDQAMACAGRSAGDDVSGTWVVRAGAVRQER
jgi:hypothetical protein